jgi:large subunit ribosomal protein L29
MAAAKAKKATKTKAKDNGILDIADVRGKTPDQLNELLVGFKKESFNLRFQKVAGEATKPQRNRAIRRNVARVMTALNEKKLETKNA